MADELESMSIGEHLEELRVRLMRIIVWVVVATMVVFCMKEETFSLLLWPCSSDFPTMRLFSLPDFQLSLVSTELSAQFMMHIVASMSIGALLVSPYILYQICGYIAPALYENERKYGTMVAVSSFVLFVMGVMMSYWVIFPFSVRFLGSYRVADNVVNMITLDSYISTFCTLTLMMGLVFQMPILAWMLAKIGLLSSELMTTYRRHAIVLIMIVAAIITPPDLFTLVLVTGPLYLLYEVCILIVKKVER